MQRTVPMTVGIRAAAIAQRAFPVSFLTVSSVVEHGQWNTVKMTVFIAVTVFQPFETSRFFSSGREAQPTSEPPDT